MKQTALRAVSLAAVAIAFATSAANASPWVATASGSDSDGSLSAEADFTFGSGTVSITITNTLSAATITSAGQTVSDLIFTIGNAPGTLGATSATGTFATFNGTATPTTAAGNPTRWLGAGGQGAFSISGDTITLEAIGGGQPDQLILPVGTTYPDANASITNGKFSPFVDGPATFTLALAGVTANTTLTDATFSFGTGPDKSITGIITPPQVPSIPVPEPSTLALLGGLLFALAGVCGLKRRGTC